MLKRLTGLSYGRKVALIAGALTIPLAVVVASPRSITWSDAQAAIPGPPRERGPASPQLRGPVGLDAGAPASEPPPEAALTAQGVVQSEDEAVIASRMTALITALPLDTGQSFSRGQLLVRFDCSQLQAQLQAADAASVAYQKTYDTNVELDQYKAIGTNEVAISKANLGKAVAEAGAIKAATNQCEITAPFSGKVVERIAHPHDIAASGQPLIKIQGAGDLKVELIVPSRWLTWLKPGAPFDFKLEETGETVQGSITRLGAVIDPVSKTLRVTGELRKQGTVLPGMSGAARFSEASA